MSARAAPQEPWRLQGLLVGLCLALVLLVYRDTTLDMVNVWNTSSTFNHCFLIPLLSLWLVWDKRAQLARIPPATSVWGLAYMLPNTGLWLAGALLDIAFFQHLALVGLLIGAAWTLIGQQAFRLLLFPLFYLYFAVPEGEFLVPTLQDITAEFSVQLLRLTGVPVYIEGRYITIPSGNFFVARACSGINYLIATLALGTLYAYLAYRSWPRRAAFMALAVVVPIVANGIRAYGIIMIAHLSDHKYAVGVDHIIYGWLFFGVVIFILFLIGNTFAEREREAEPATGPPAPPARPAHTGLLGLAALAMAASGPLLLAQSDRQSPAPASLALPAAGALQPAPLAEPFGARYMGAAVQTAGYQLAGRTVGLTQAYYAEQREDAELVLTVNKPYDKKAWRVPQRSAQATGAGFEARELVLRSRRSRGQGYLLWWWYDAHGTRTTSQIEAKLAQARARLLGADTGAAAYHVFTPLADVENLAPAREALRHVVSTLQPTVTPGPP